MGITGAIFLIVTLGMIQFMTLPHGDLGLTGNDVMRWSVISGAIAAGLNITITKKGISIRRPR